MKCGIIIVLLVIIIFSAIGCSDAPADKDTDDGDGIEETTGPGTESGSDQGPGSVSSQLPNPGGEEVYAYITEGNNYKEWDLWPLKDEAYASTSIHGPLLSTYVSDGTAEAINNRVGELPAGSIIVRESYDVEGDLREIGVRYKSAGFDRGNNDWFWAAYTPDGEVIVEGKVGSCLNCHSIEADNDYIYTSYIIDTPFDVVDVEIRDHSFDPESFTIAAGDTVRWTNMDSAAHAINGGSFRSPVLLKGESYNYTFSRAGTYNYMCMVHPYQTTGQVIVTG
jgi:plastocyanin